MPSPTYIGSSQYLASGMVNGSTTIITRSVAAGRFLILAQLTNASNSLVSISSITDDGLNTWTNQQWGEFGNARPDTWYAVLANPITAITVHWSVSGSDSNIAGKIIVGEYSAFTPLSVAIRFSGTTEVHYPAIASPPATSIAIIAQSNNTGHNPFLGPDIGGTVRQSFQTDGVAIEGEPIYYADICLIDNLSGTNTVSQTVGSAAGTNFTFAAGGIIGPPAGAVCALDVTPTSLSFSATEGGVTPATQQVSLSNIGNADPIGWTATPSDSWITVNPSSGTTPDVADIGVDLTGLTLGDYSGTVTFASACGDVVVDVTLTVAASCLLDVAPSSLSFSAEQGTTPASQTLSVMNSTGSDPIAFTITLSDSWISIAASGTSPQDIVVSIDTAGLSQGTYNGTVVFSSACNDVTIDLTLIVTPPPPPPPEEPCVEPTGCPFTLNDGVEALGQRLYDPTHQFWTVAELTRYIVESLRTWNALASYWRDEFVFDAASAGDGFGAGGFGSGGFGGVGGPANTWIDLTVPPTSLRPLTVTDQYLLEVIEYHLLEPLTSTFPLTWTGSRQFSVVDLQSALQRRRDETLGVTGCFITRLIVPSLPGRIALPNKVIELRRVAFLPDQTVVDLPLVVPMFQDDQWALQAFRQSFTTDPFELPRIWAQSTEPYVAGPTGPQLSFDVNPLPGTPGEYEVLVIQSGGILCESAASTSTIPDDWTWVAKFGALADLMSRESNAKDSLRAKYAEGRYRQGLALLASSPALLTMRVNNLPLQIDAIKSADEYQTTWETLSAQAQPMMALTAGLNLVALSPPPDAPNGVERAITAGVVRNAPVPALLTDCIQVGRDLWDVIIDYAQHLAAIKMGGQEFIATAPLYDRFMKAASLYNSKLKEMGQFRDLLYNRSQLEPAMNPRYTLDGDPANG